jgi:hypothetical protein
VVLKEADAVHAIVDESGTSRNAGSSTGKERLTRRGLVNSLRCILASHELFRTAEGTLVKPHVGLRNRQSAVVLLFAMRSNLRRWPL